MNLNLLLKVGSCTDSDISVKNIFLSFSALCLNTFIF